MGFTFDVVVIGDFLVVVAEGIEGVVGGCSEEFEVFVDFVLFLVVDDELSVCDVLWHYNCVVRYYYRRCGRWVRKYFYKLDVKTGIVRLMCLISFDGLNVCDLING